MIVAALIVIGAFLLFGRSSGEIVRQAVAPGGAADQTFQARNPHVSIGERAGQVADAALKGGAAGAVAGSAILPGIGTAIGAAFGAIVGVITAAVNRPRGNVILRQAIRDALAEQGVSNDDQTLDWATVYGMLLANPQDFLVENTTGRPALLLLYGASVDRYPEIHERAEAARRAGGFGAWQGSYWGSSVQASLTDGQVGRFTSHPLAYAAPLKVGNGWSPLHDHAGVPYTKIHHLTADGAHPITSRERGWWRGTLADHPDKASQVMAWWERETGMTA